MDTGDVFVQHFGVIALTVVKTHQSNAWDAWRWRKSMWLANHDGAITLGVSLHEDMTKFMLYQSEAGRCSWNTDC